MNKTTVSCLIVGATCLVSLPAAALNLNPYVTGGATYSLFGNDHGADNADDEFGFRIGAGLNLTENLAVELAYDQTKADLDNGSGKVKNKNTLLDLLYYPNLGSVPVYGLVGGGFGEYGDNKANVYEAGLGVAVPLMDSGVGLRADYRYRYGDGRHSSDQDYHDNVFTVGLVYPSRDVKGEAPPPPPPPPPPAPVVEPPATEPAPVVDLTQKEPIVLSGIQFAFDSAKLKPGSTSILDEAVKALNAHPDVKVSVTGYTDTSGDVNYNLKLSKHRADAVRQYLIDHGIDASRIQAQGLGESNPIADNATRDGRKQNRRVELQVVN